MQQALQTSHAWVTLIDGRSGAGKTMLANELAEVSTAQVLHLEDLYPGWLGLSQGSRAVARALESGQYHRYDWQAEAFASDATQLEGQLPLIIEGCGAITAANLAAATRWASGARVHSIWLEVAEQRRKQQALARDGSRFTQYWPIWAEQENLHFARHQPWALADEVRDDSDLHSSSR
jgi:hypothetical protein